MATVTYEDYLNSSKNSSTHKREFKKVGYFSSLSEDGDEAIVRFDYDTPSEFDLQTIHKIRLNNGAYRSVACLKEKEGDFCPLCANGENKPVTKFYVKLLEYVKDEEGKIVPVAKVWERPSMFTQSIMGAYTTALELGAITPETKIRDLVFRIKRKGAHKDMKTTFEVSPLNKNIFKDEIYVKDFSAFENLDLAHHSYMKRSVSEINDFLTTGEFPMKESKPVEVETPVGPCPVETTPKAEPVPSSPSTPSSPSMESTQTTPRRYSF